MNISLLLRLVSLVAVVICGVIYFQIRGQKIRLETNLNVSRSTLQQKLEENAILKSRTLIAEENSNTMTQVAEEEKSKATDYRDQLDGLKNDLNTAQAELEKAKEEIGRLAANNRDMQRQINNLQASVPPQNWRERINQLQSRVLELEAVNTSMRKSLAAAGQNIGAPTLETTIPSTTVQKPSVPVGEVIRMGPDGSFVILSFGRQLGAAEGQTLTIRRDGQTVALVSLTQITNDFSIAQILSTTNTGSSLSVPDIQIGDSAHLE